MTSEADSLPTLSDSTTPFINPAKVPPPLPLGKREATNPWVMIAALATMACGLISHWAWLGFTG
ncbi:MAG: hypothetical protein ACRC6M_12155, partial [Microcystaceae cyanobacterium]